MQIIEMAARIPRARAESAQMFSGQKDIQVSSNSNSRSSNDKR